MSRPTLDELPEIRSRFEADINGHQRVVLDIDLADGTNLAVGVGRGLHKPQLIGAGSKSTAEYGVVSQDNLQAMLNGLTALNFPRIYRSLRDAQPLDTNAARSDEKLHAELCARDADCDGGNHVWVTVLDDAARFIGVWHVNLSNATVVPLRPLIAEHE